MRATSGMTIASAECFLYALPFRDPVEIGSRSVQPRPGALLCLKTENGAEGWGEAAPLPGFSREPLAEATEALQRRARDLIGTKIPSNGGEATFERLPRMEIPSVAFAIETALVNLIAETSTKSVQDVLGGGRGAVRVNGLVPNLLSNTERTVERLQRVGYAAVKLKVGRRDPEQEASAVQAFRHALGPEVAIRLDANRAWTLEQAYSFVRHLGPVSLDYIEEPLQNPNELPRFVTETELPVALDETTRDGSPEAVLSNEYVTAVVLKPTLLGGIRTIRRWVRTAQRSNVRPVFSGSYEAGVGMRMLVLLASVFSKAPAGLGTYRRLERDILDPPLPLNGATVSVEQTLESRIDRSRLDSFENIDSSQSLDDGYDG